MCVGVLPGTTVSAIMRLRAAKHSSPLANWTSSMAESPTYPFPRTPSMTTWRTQTHTYTNRNECWKKIFIVVRQRIIGALLPYINNERGKGQHNAKAISVGSYYLEVFRDSVQRNVSLFPLITLISRPDKSWSQFRHFLALWFNVHIQLTYKSIKSNQIKRNKNAFCKSHTFLSSSNYLASQGNRIHALRIPLTEQRGYVS